MRHLLLREAFLSVALVTISLFFSSSVGAADTKPIPPQFTDKSFFLTAIINATGTPSGAVSGITTPHHLLARDLIANTFLVASKGSYDRIIVLSPDHFNLGDTDISIASRDFGTVFGDINTDKSFVDQLMGLLFVSTSDFFYREHGIQAELPFVKYYFPQTPIVAITLKEMTPKDELDKFIKLLESKIDKHTLIVQSTDFSHYLPSDVANAKDRQTIAVLKAGNPQKLFSLNQPDNIDSIAAQYIQMRLQKEIFNASLRILADKNSQNYTKIHVQSTTSYITQTFTQNYSIGNNSAISDQILSTFKFTK